MLMSVIGFLISALVVWDINITWGFTFSLIFGLWFIAAVYNFTHAEEGDHLDIHDTNKLARKSRAKPKN